MSASDQHSPYGNGDADGDYQQSSSSGPMRTNDNKADDRDKKGPIAAPVKSACTFCRSRKSRCDGNKPCSACVGRGRPDECLYTVSRRGGKPKPKADPTQDLQSHLNKLFAMTDMPYAFRRPGGLAGPSAADASAAPGMHPQPQQQQQVQPHSSVFNIPTQYQSFDPSVLQQPSSLAGGLQMQQPQSGLPSAQQPAPAFSFGDPMQDPFAGIPGFQAGGFMRYQLPDAAQQSSASQMLVQSQPPQQHQPQHQQHQQHQPQTQPGNYNGASLPSQMQGLQQQPQQQRHTVQQGASSNTAAQLAATSSPPGAGSDGTRNPSNLSPRSNPSPSAWARIDDAMAAYHASSVAAPSTSSQSSSSRHTSIDNVVDPSKIKPMSFKTLNAAAAEAGSVKALLTDYYRYLYRFIPVLPPPKHMDVLAKFFQPDSAFIYALQCVLPLLRDEIQPIGAMHKLSGQGINFGSDEKKAALRERTLAFERKATEGLDQLLEQADGDEAGDKMLEAVQTLCVLVVYEYGSGRAIKARLKADQALGLAMGQGLHKLSHKTAPNQNKSAPSSFANVSNAGHPLTAMGVDPNDIFEMRKRCWWSVWSLVLWAAYNTGRIPTIRADDPRVKSEMPVASSPDVWTSNISSLQALLLVQDRVLALAQYGQSQDGSTGGFEPPRREASMSPSSSSAGSPFAFGRLGASRSGSVSSDETPATFSALPTKASRQDILSSMLDIDNFLQDQIRIHEATEAPDSPLPSEVPLTGDLAHVEKELEDSLRMAAAVQLYTSSLTLHIGQAFQGASLFERKLCFLNSIKDNKDGSSSAVCREPMPVLAHDGALDLAPYAMGNGSGNLDLSSQSTAAAPTNLTPQDLYARGPFLPRLSLLRCVHASRKLLDIAKRRHGQSVNPNPFNCCSFVLISFVLLMQALAVHGGFAGDGAMGEEHTQKAGPQGDEMNEFNGHGEYANESLQRVLEHSGKGDDDMMDDFVPSIDPVKQAQLRDIWGRVREARDTLMDLGKHWEAVVPMADEVNLCLETSQLLLSNAY